MRQHLHTWLMENAHRNENKQLFFETAAAQQAMFVRDMLAPLVWADIPYNDLPRVSDEAYKDQPETCFVVGEHCSKSTALAAYQFERPDLGLRMVMRNNYYNWNITFHSETPIPQTALSGFTTDFDTEEDRKRWSKSRYWSYLFFEGFPYEDMKGPWSLDPTSFSTWCVSDYDLYTMIFNVLQYVRKESPKCPT